MGLLDNAITVEEFQKRKKESLAKSRFKETGSVMSRPISEEWQPDNVRHGGHALEAPMFSPDDLIGSGIFSKLGLLATSAAPALASGLLGVVAKNKGVSTMPSKIARALDKQAGAIAWHGSPHKFDKFDMSKIGSGEGAQAYGHGLYMAEAQDVAHGYRNNLTYKAGEVPKIGGKEVQDYYSQIMDRANRLPPQRAQLEYDKLAMLEDLMGEQATPQMVLAGASDRGYQKQAVEWFKKEVLPKYEMPGAMYKVDIPDEAVARFLDWDKPLSQQAPEVRAAIGKMRDQFPISKNGWDIKPWMDADPLASTWHNEAVRELGLGQDYFTKHLSESGVPGIRYLDGGSRGTGQGTSNYVLFDDQLPRILERNGQPTGLQPWAKGEWKGLLDEPAPKLTEFEQRHLIAQKNAALPVEQGGLGLPPNNTAMDRARAMGFDTTAYHGTQRATEPISSFSSQKSYYGDEGAGVHWMNDSPEVASDYATWVNNIGNPTVYPTMIRKGKQPTDEQFYSASNRHMVDSDPGISLYDNKFVEYLKKNGFDSYDIPTYGYDPAADFGQGTIENITTAVFNPANIRSRFAAFDPKRRHEADILGYADPRLLGAIAGGGLLGLGGYSMMNDK